MILNLTHKSGKRCTSLWGIHLLMLINFGIFPRLYSPSPPLPPPRFPDIFFIVYRLQLATLNAVDIDFLYTIYITVIIIIIWNLQFVSGDWCTTPALLSGELGGLNISLVFIRIALGWNYNKKLCANPCQKGEKLDTLETRLCLGSIFLFLIFVYLFMFLCNYCANFVC